MSILISKSDLSQTKTEIRPGQPIPTFEVLGIKLILTPDFTSIVLLLLVVVAAIKELNSSPMVKIALTILATFDLEMQETLDHVATTLQHLTGADRVVIAFFHNGAKNSVFHYKKLSIMAEACKLGVMQIREKYTSRMVSEIFTKADLDFYKDHNACFKFVAARPDDARLSIKRRGMLVENGVARSDDRFLLDDMTRQPFGVLSLQYLDEPRPTGFLGFGVKHVSEEVEKQIDETVTLLYTLIQNRVHNTPFHRMHRWGVNTFKRITGKANEII